jgi:hypothetical protein
MGRDDAGGCIEAEPLNQQVGKFAPLEIILLDELNLPIALPFLQLLLAGDRLNGSFIGLHVNEPVNTVFADEFGSTSHPMLFEPETKIIGYADIQGAVPAACEDVDVVKHVLVKPAERRSLAT